jgi:hypothetical protein
MPNFSLTDADVYKMVAYINSLTSPEAVNAAKLLKTI